MKQKIFGYLVISAFAVYLSKPVYSDEMHEMCVLNNINFFILHTSVDGTIDTSCTENTSTNKRFSILFTDAQKNYNRRITGIASCNAIHTSDGTENGTAFSRNKVFTKLRASASDTGSHCWCKWEPMYDSSKSTCYPSKTGLASYWQYLKEYNSDSDCADNCTADCVSAIAFNEKPSGETEDKYGFRTVMFNSLW